MHNIKIKTIMKKSIYIIVFILIAAVIGLIILKYNVEGEKNLPFELSNIIIVSSAEGKETDKDNNYLWNMEILQSNDIYLNIEKNLNYKETEIIKNIRIENIQITKKPQIGEIEIYRSNGKQSGELFNYSEEYKVTDKLEYFGDLETDTENFKISNQGGTISIRVLNKTGAKYYSNDEIFEHNGKLLQNANINKEDIETSISFNFVISLESGIEFSTYIKLDLPIGDIAKEGTCHKELENTENFVFKRN